MLKWDLSQRNTSSRTSRIFLCFKGVFLASYSHLLLTSSLIIPLHQNHSISIISAVLSSLLNYVIFVAIYNLKMTNEEKIQPIKPNNAVLLHWTRQTLFYISLWPSLSVLTCSVMHQLTLLLYYSLRCIKATMVFSVHNPYNISQAFLVSRRWLPGFISGSENISTVQRHLRSKRKRKHVFQVDTIQKDPYIKTGSFCDRHNNHSAPVQSQPATVLLWFLHSWLVG